MAIAEMSEVLILGRKRDNLEVIRALQDAGVVQLDPLEDSEIPRGVLLGADATRKALLDRLLARAESSLAAMGATDVVADHKKLVGVNVENLLEEIGGRTDALAMERSELSAELSAIGGFQSLARTLGDLTSGIGKGGRLVAIGLQLADSKELAKLESSLNESGLSFSVGHQPAGRSSAAVVAVRTQDAAAARSAISKAGLSELRFPGKFEGLNYTDASALMEQRSRTAPEEMQGILASLESLKNTHAATIAAARANLKDELARFDAVTSSVAGKYGFALRGWLPKDNHGQLEQSLTPLKGQVIYQFSDAPEHHADHVPVKLNNNSILKPFERLLAIMPLPAYGTFDPTWVLAIAFPLFFGWIIGDVGLGAVSILVGFMFGNMARNGKSLKIDIFGANLNPAILSDVSKLLYWMGTFSMIFGVVFGEFFGTLGEYIGIFKFAGETSNALITAPIHRVAASAAGLMILISLIPGVIQVLGGWILRAYLGAKHRDTSHLLEGIGMFLGATALLPWVGQFALGWTFPSWVLPVQIGLIVFGVFVLGTFAKKTLVMGIEMITNFSNLLSYLRLYAVGLSGAALANFATDTGWALGNQIGGFAGILLAIIAATFMHLAFIALTIIGHILTPLRLQYVEFFTKFGYYDHNGHAYRPLAKLGGKDATNV
jgi:V/A-type H+/Na+-transporting ATPase subunit I